MNTFSHILVGSLLQKYIKEQNGVELNWTSFIYGNLLPDFRPVFKKLPHKTDSWESYIKSEIETLSEHKQTGLYFGADYSRRLGILCHFYADFFCYPHTEAFEGGSYQHLKYEWELNRFIRKRYIELNQTDFGGQVARSQNTERIFGKYRALQEAYLSEDQAYENDIVYTLCACVDTIAMVTRASILTPDVQRLFII